ncbi:MAG TPA: transposase [Pyrinomonadaceae bacterium]|nr:transposase [Pyrinomonadaceae bacterium]
MYYWRSLSDKQRKEVSEYRRTQRFPRHSPPHFDSDLSTAYIITAACYEHKIIPGKSSLRMSVCEGGVLSVCEQFAEEIYAWCILPNHYHVLLRTAQMKKLRQELGLFHGRSSFKWNGEDDSRGRQVWHNCFERKMKSERHFYASLNYVLNNAVHHGYVNKWQDWLWSSAEDYLNRVGLERAAEIWREYPILDYGSGWDIY